MVLAYPLCASRIGFCGAPPPCANGISILVCRPATETAFSVCSVSLCISDISVSFWRLCVICSRMNFLSSRNSPIRSFCESCILDQQLDAAHGAQFSVQPRGHLCILDQQLDAAHGAQFSVVIFCWRRRGGWLEFTRSRQNEVTFGVGSCIWRRHGVSFMDLGILESGAFVGDAIRVWRCQRDRDFFNRFRANEFEKGSAIDDPFVNGIAVPGRLQFVAIEPPILAVALQRSISRPLSALT